LPPQFNFDRYSKIGGSFAVRNRYGDGGACATPDFAKDLYIANAARSPEAIW